MEQPKEDRRARRTRRALQDALIALLVEKRYDAITVQDIIDRADVGRSTFYAHFQDKDDLFRCGFQEALAGLGERLHDIDDQALVPSLELFRHVAQHQHLYHALVRGQGLDVLYRSGQDFLRQRMTERLAEMAAPGPAPAVPLPLIANYLAESLLGLIKWWLDQHMPYSAERMDEIFQQLVMPGVRAGLRPAG